MASVSVRARRKSRTSASLMTSAMPADGVHLRRRVAEVARSRRTLSVT